MQSNEFMCRKHEGNITNMPDFRFEGVFSILHGENVDCICCHLLLGDQNLKQNRTHNTVFQKICTDKTKMLQWTVGLNPFKLTKLEQIRFIIRLRVADQHPFNAYLDPDSAFHFNANHDPSPHMRPMVYGSSRAPFRASTPPFWASTALHGSFRASKAPEFRLKCEPGSESSFSL